MNETMQTILALGLVAAALGFLVWRWLRRRGSACDDADCSCGKSVLRKPRK
jgi:hypothetical protein